MRALILEDEAPAYRRLQNLIDENHSDIQVVDVIDSVSNAIKWLDNHQCPDLIFSDIRLSDGISFDIFKEITPECPIIFTTAYDEYMLDAFKTNGIDYLLKPIEPEELDRSLEKFKQLSKSEFSESPIDLSALLQAVNKTGTKYKERFLIKLGTKLLPIQVDDIAYFIYLDGSTELYTLSGKKYLMDQSLDELEKQIDPTIFFRLNRQYLAHINSIKEIHQYFKGRLKIDLNPMINQEVTVSREKATAFKNWMDGA